MPTENLNDSISAIADMVLDSATTAQDAFLSVVGSVSETLKPLTDKLQSLPLADLVPDPMETVDATFSFAEKVLSSQKAFTAKLVKSYGFDKTSAAV